jgi:hypothetical protein
MVSRRTVIAGGAGAAVLTALGYRARDRGVFTSGEGPAYAAWQEWQGHPGEGSKRPLHAAILAASAHNSQPWLFEPHEDSITVYADLSRNLGAADPFRRELYAGLGCAIYNLNLAAGHSLEVPLPEIEDRRLRPNPVSQLVQVCDAPLLSEADWAHADRQQELAALPRRHTNRGPYQQGRRVPESFLKSYGFSRYVTDAAAVKEMGALIVEATERFIADPEMSRDSGRWFRTGRREIEARRDGVTTDTAGLSPFMNGMAKLLPDQNVAAADKYWLAATRDVQVPTAAAYGVLFAPDRLTTLGAIATGANWQRLHLAATMAGLAAQPMNQPVEIMDCDHLLGRKNDYAREIAKIAAPQGSGEMGDDVAFIFRLGYAEREAKPSPRRRFGDVLRRTGFA